MEAHRHLISLRGANLPEGRISARLLRDLLDILIDGSRKALRFRIQGTSTPGGREPKWLTPAADFDVVLAPSKGHVAEITARPLIDTLPRLFEQQSLFDQLEPNKSPLDLFEDAIEDATKDREDSQRFDSGLLKSVASFDRLLRQGSVESFQLVNGRDLFVDSIGAERARSLAERTPPSVPARAIGILEGISYSDRRFKLSLPDGSALLGHAQEFGTTARATLKRFWGQRVAISGLLEFRPSGVVAGLAATTIAKAADDEVPDALLLDPLPVESLSPERRSAMFRIVKEAPPPNEALTAAFRRHRR